MTGHGIPEVCNYALLRFLPYPETGEFVNIGVVVHSPSSGFFGAEFESNTQRVTDFFPELDRQEFEMAEKAIQKDIERVHDLVSRCLPAQDAQRLFMELIRPRESTFRFSEVRTVRDHQVSTLPERLFSLYVSRSFTKGPEAENQAA